MINHCQTCRHWTPNVPPPWWTSTSHGVCNHILSAVDYRKATDTPVVIADSDDRRATLHTLPDFGCVLHQPTEDKS